jgi:co-chaperonin GroES (HSP10)
MKLVNNNVLLRKIKEMELIDVGSVLAITTAKPTSLCKILNIDNDSSLKDKLSFADKVCVYEHSGISLIDYTDDEHEHVVIKDTEILLTLDAQGNIEMLGDRILTKVFVEEDKGELTINQEDKTKAEILFSNTKGFKVGDIVAHPRFAGVEVNIPNIKGSLKIFHKNEILFIL